MSCCFLFCFVFGNEIILTQILTTNDKLTIIIQIQLTLQESILSHLASERVDLKKGMLRRNILKNGMSRKYIKLNQLNAIKLH